MVKSLDARRHRRTRLKRAMLPVIEMLGCTQMQAADAIKGVFNENQRLKDALSAKDAKIQELETRFVEQQTSKTLLLEQIEVRDTQIKDLEQVIADLRIDEAAITADEAAEGV